MPKLTHDLHPLPPRHPQFLPSSKAKPHAAAKSQSKGSSAFSKVFNGEDAKTILTKWLGDTAPQLMSNKILSYFEAKNPSPFWSEEFNYDNSTKKYEDDCINYSFTWSDSNPQRKSSLKPTDLEEKKTSISKIKNVTFAKESPHYRCTSPTFSDDSELPEPYELNEEALATITLGEAPDDFSFFNNISL